MFLQFQYVEWVVSTKLTYLIRYMILNHSLNVLLLFQGSNVALCELGTFDFRFRTTNTHTPEAMKGTVYKWEIYSRKLIGKKPEKGFIIQCRNFWDSRGAPSFRWSMWVVSLNFFRVVFFRSTFLPAYWLIAIFGCAKILILKPSKSKKAFLRESRQKPTLTFEEDPFLVYGRHHVFDPSKHSQHWGVYIEDSKWTWKGAEKSNPIWQEGHFFDVPWACWDGWAVFVGGGFKDFWSSSIPGEMNPIWLIFFKGVEATN